MESRLKSLEDKIDRLTRVVEGATPTSTQYYNPLVSGKHNSLAAWRNAVIRPEVYTAAERAGVRMRLSDNGNVIVMGHHERAETAFAAELVRSGVIADESYWQFVLV